MADWTDLTPTFSQDDQFSFQDAEKFNQNQQVLRLAMIGPAAKIKVPIVRAERTNTFFLSGVPERQSFNVVKQITEGFRIEDVFQRFRFLGAGYYVITHDLRWEANNAGRREVVFRKNGSLGIHTMIREASGGGEHKDNQLLVHRFDADDFLEMEMRQTSGGVLTLKFSEIEISWVGNSTT